MNKIINGKRYNTKTATSIHKTGQEELFLKRTGEFFLADWGREKIAPLTQERAEKWAEENLSGEEYEKIFGVVEDDEKTRITIYVSPSLANKIKQLAIERKISMSEMAERMIERF